VGDARRGYGGNADRVTTARDAVHATGASLLILLETALAQGGLLELDFATEVLERPLPRLAPPRERACSVESSEVDGVRDDAHLRAVWGDWTGREEELYRHCGELVSRLSFAEILSRCGHEARSHAKILRATESKCRVVTYGGLDPIDMPRASGSRRRGVAPPDCRPRFTHFSDSATVGSYAPHPRRSPTDRSNHAQPLNSRGARFVLSYVPMVRTELPLVVVAALFLTHPATADVRFVERPLTLAPFQVSADIGVGAAQATQYDFGENVPPSRYPTTYKVGLGGSMEWAMGLPYVGQLGLRVGETPDVPGQLANADRFGRVLDPIHAPVGDGAAFKGPELDWRRTFFTRSVFEIGIDARALFSENGRFYLGLAAGAPVRIHLSPFVRLDTGIYFASGDVSPWAQIPAQLFFQIGDTFLGPEVAILSNSYSLASAFPVGFGVGHTFGGIVDVKAEARVSDVSVPEHTLGGGIGVGVRL
jgi:hypothetical protein